MSCILGGIYTGLQDRFGSDVIAGYRAYRKDCAIERAALKDH